jgi:hypothetical protein
MNYRFFALAIAAFGMAGCYWSSPPTQPFPHRVFDVATTPELGEPAVASLRSPRVIVLGRFQSIGSQPIGGLYDEHDFQASPLYRTYSFPDADIELFEQTCDALRATGLDVRKDYALADGRLLEPRLKAVSPILISTVIVSVQHDQLRTEAGRDYELARLVAEVTVRDPGRGELLRRRYEVQGKRASVPDADVLGALGRTFGAALAADPDFRRAIEVSR